MSPSCHATLGGLLVVLGLGAVVGMRVAGPLTDRYGTRTVVPAGGVLCGTTLFLPGLAHDPWTPAAALLVFGLRNGCPDVSVNAHAVHVEKASGACRSRRRERGLCGGGRDVTARRGLRQHGPGPAAGRPGADGDPVRGRRQRLERPALLLTLLCATTAVRAGVPHTGPDRARRPEMAVGSH
ncbi:MFS transporter [Streptomyces sp. NBRC 110028]|uniref:MFS transporter n=1 Tax=Streptomyces sp. NBRC 110028 TaxID=1621260 RepID=UPI0006E207FE